MLSFVWFVKRNEMKDIYFLFLNLSEFERDKFKIFSACFPSISPKLGEQRKVCPRKFCVHTFQTEEMTYFPLISLPFTLTSPFSNIA